MAATSKTRVIDAAPAVRVSLILDVKETARLLRMNPESVTRLFREGVFTGGQVGKKLLLNGTSVADYLNERGIPAVVVVEDVA